MTETTIDATSMRAQARQNHYTLSFTDEGGNRVIARVPHDVWEANTQRFVIDDLRKTLTQADATTQASFKAMRTFIATLESANDDIKTLDSFEETGPEEGDLQAQTIEV